MNGGLLYKNIEDMMMRDMAVRCIGTKMEYQILESFIVEIAENE